MALKTKYSPLQHFSVDNLFNAYGDLSSRNKLISLAVVGAILFLILFIPLSLLSGKVASLKKEITVAQKGYRQVEEKVMEYEKTRTKITELESQFGPSTGSLTTRIEALAKESGVTVDQLKEKAPQETDFLGINSIEVKLLNVSLQQAIDFFSKIEGEQASPMRVRRVQIKPKGTNRQVLDVSCEVATFVLRKEV